MPALRRSGVRDAAVLLLMGFLDLLVWSALRGIGYRRVSSVVDRVPTILRLREPDRFVRRCVWGVSAARRRLPTPGTCLSRSVLLKALLRLVGLRGTVRFGVRSGAAVGLDAHAWLELDGRPLNDHPDVATDYLTLDPIPPA
ncbi:MAG: lasso peptide biosynthesis B2 protein [Actinomycetota bacterium]|nr:lasso peptide biosynthesis B2 protein [Actinomycetota bacterium]